MHFDSPIAFLLLLAIPVGLVSYRGAQAPVVLALCLGAGLLFLVVDGLLAATAKIHGLTLVTRNTADVARTGVPLLNPFE